MSNISEIVSLIESLYSTKSGQDVNRTQQTLQSIQKSEDALYLAHELLGNDQYTPSVKYFGALTLTVQLNGNSGLKPTLWNILKLNMIHLTRYCAMYKADPQSFGVLKVTIKKLMSNLSLIFTNLNYETVSSIDDDEYAFLERWKNPLNTMIHLLSNLDHTPPSAWLHFEDSQINEFLKSSINVEVPYDTLIDFINSNTIWNELTLTFIEIIVEDICKFQSKRHSLSEVHKAVHEHLYISAMAVINVNLSLTVAQKGTNLINDVLFNCISSVITYVSIARNAGPAGRMNLDDLFHNMLQVMCSSTEEDDKYEKGEKVLSILGNVFANDPTIINHELRQEIESIFLGVSRSGCDTSRNSWMIQYMNYLVSCEMHTELRELATCMVDLLLVNVLDVSNKLFSNASNEPDKIAYTQEYIRVLLQITKFPLTPVIEEFFSVKMIEFWLELANTYVELPAQSLRFDASQVALNIFQPVVSIYLPKISLATQILITKDEGPNSSSINEFEDFRTAMAELAQSIWPILGNANFTDVLLSGTGSVDATSLMKEPLEFNDEFFQLESMLFLLNSLLTDMNLTESTWIRQTISTNIFFINNVLVLLRIGCIAAQDPDVSVNNVILQIVRTSTNVLSALAGYFFQEPTLLDSCIQTLFESLGSCTSHPTLINEKIEVLLIKSIAVISDTCRCHLVAYIPQFFMALRELLNTESPTSSFTNAKLIKSIGYIIQADLIEGPDKQATVILELVNIIDNYIDSNLTHVDQDMKIQDRVHSLLSYVSELGSSLIQREEFEDPAMLQKTTEARKYWENDPMKIRDTIKRMIDKILSNPAYKNNAGVIETSCLIMGKALRLPEEDPHFLRYSMDEIMTYILNYIQICDIRASLPYFSYLMEIFIVHFKQILSSQEFDFLFSKTFMPFYADSILQDPDLLQAMINLVVAVLDTKPGLVVHSETWTHFILPQFMQYLTSTEKFTISATTRFWTKVLNNRRYTHEDLHTVQQQITPLGPQLSLQVLYGLLHTQRSDINCYTDVLRALVAKYPTESKNWLVNALPQICDKSAAHEKFINKLSVTRGSRAAGNAVLEWWIECNSMPTY